MNHKSKLAAIAAYGTPSIARAMEEVDTRRFNGVSKAARDYKLKNDVRIVVIRGCASMGVKVEREKKVELLRKKIDMGFIPLESMPAILRDYPELKKKGTK